MRVKKAYFGTDRNKNASFFKANLINLFHALKVGTNYKTTTHSTIYNRLKKLENSGHIVIDSCTTDKVINVSVEEGLIDGISIVKCYVKSILHRIRHKRNTPKTKYVIEFHKTSK